MDFEAIFAHFPPVLHKYWFVVLLGILGLIFFIYGLISLLVSNQQKSNSDFTEEQPIPVKSLITISVDVEGAVVNPGVYKLPLDSIIQDALVASKGLAEDADRDYVSKNINLAQKITEGTKIYIPRTGEATNQSDYQSVNQNTSGLININSAVQSELNDLPGVGPVTSEKIINGRPYSNINELLDRKIVSNKVFSQIKDKITAY